MSGCHAVDIMPDSRSLRTFSANISFYEIYSFGTRKLA